MNRGKRKLEVPKEGAEVRKKNRGSGGSLYSTDQPVPAMPRAEYAEVEKSKADEVARLKEIFPDLSTNFLKVQVLVCCMSHSLVCSRKRCHWGGALRQQLSCCCNQVRGRGTKVRVRVMPA